MGEIKSTLDLVMEKTKNLNLSDAEKQNQKNKEIESRLRGLVQKYQDGLISMEQFTAEYETLRKDHTITGNQNVQLLKVVCSKIVLGKDNQALLSLLSRFADSDIEGLTSVLQDFNTAIQAAAEAQNQIVKDRLASEHLITGSAVVPNLQRDEDWHKMVADIRAKFDELLRQAKIKLLAV
ncbi:MAG: hypothetical protein PVG35_10440 [Desulfobacterales bacterium]|jgi:hypothetical protein